MLSAELLLLQSCKVNSHACLGFKFGRKPRRCKAEGLATNVSGLDRDPIRSDRCMPSLTCIF
jgi:hypothetical protein